MTFSIAARDGDAWGVAVASRFLAVGSLVPAVRVGVGAVATQAMARVAYLCEVLDALAAGSTTADAVATAVAADVDRDHRQLGVVGPDGPVTYTGSQCLDWAGGRAGGDDRSAYAVQGNILTGPEVVDAMERAWHEHTGQRLDERLVAVLLAGDAAGGDSRGRQSAALLVRQAGAGYDAGGVLADLRVDDHPDAPSELARLLSLSMLYFGTPQDVQPLEGALREEVAGRLAALGHDEPDTAAALADWMGRVNLENRHADGGIDGRVLAVLRGTDPTLTQP
jgi:uncharacterized Ntn-hydrolase superfamily protein